MNKVEAKEYDGLPGFQLRLPGGRVYNRDGLRGGVSVGVEEEADNIVERKGV